MNSLEAYFAQRDWILRSGYYRKLTCFSAYLYADFKGRDTLIIYVRDPDEKIARFAFTLTTATGQRSRRGSNAFDNLSIITSSMQNIDADGDFEFYSWKAFKIVKSHGRVWKEIVGKEFAAFFESYIPPMRRGDVKIFYKTVELFDSETEQTADEIIAGAEAQTIIEIQKRWDEKWEKRS